MARLFLGLTALFCCSIALSAGAAEPHASGHTQRYLVQAANVNAARRSVMSVGATVEQSLPIVSGVAAHLSSSQAHRLRTT
jgi:hypothetical protein